MVDLPRQILYAALTAFLAVALGTVSLVLLWEYVQERRRRSRVLEDLRALANEPFDRVAPRESILSSAILQSPWLRALAARLPAIRGLELLLQQARIEWTLQTHLLLSAGLALGLGLAGAILWGTPLAALPTGAIGGYLPTAYVRRRRARRVAAFEEVLPECIDLVARALRAGHPLSAGFKMAADDGPEPVAAEFRRVFEEQRFGLPLQDSLLGMVDRVSLVDIRILATAILIQREVGGNLAEILDTLARVIRARFTIRRQIKVYTAQGRMTGYLLALLPFTLFALLYALNPDYMSVLFTDPAGRMLVVGALAMQVTGFLWIRKIINIEI